LDFNGYKGVDYDYLREAYFDLYLENTDIRAGRQLVNWGTAYELNPIDLVNPLDLTTTDPLEFERGVAALKAKYYYDFNTIFTGVMIGEHRPATLPVGMENMAGQMIQGVAYENLVENIYQQTGNLDNAESMAGAIINNNCTVSSPIAGEIDSVEDVEIALKAMWRNINGYDISLSYFHGYQDMPTVVSNLGEVYAALDEVTEKYMVNGTSDKEIEIELGYKQTDSFGFNVIGSIKDVGVWTEMNYAQNADEEEKIDLVFGGDYTFENGFYTVVQYFHREYKDNLINNFLAAYSEGELIHNQNFLILHGEIPFKQIHNWQANFIYDLDNDNYMLNPEVNYSLTNNINFDIGTIIYNEKNSTSGFDLLPLLSEEKSYIQFTYSF